MDINRLKEVDIYSTDLKNARLKNRVAWHIFKTFVGKQAFMGKSSRQLNKSRLFIKKIQNVTDSQTILLPESTATREEV
jgi:hypothetical protein